MVKFTAFIALFAVALLLSNAFAYHTTVTTVEIDEDNQEGSRERCRELQGRQQLRSCQQFLRQQRGRGALLLDNQREQMDECCRELRQVDRECRCDKIEEIVREQQQQERGQEGRQILETARNLPAMCGLRPQRCNF